MKKLRYYAMLIGLFGVLELSGRGDPNYVPSYPEVLVNKDDLVDQSEKIMDGDWVQLRDMTDGFETGIFYGIHLIDHKKKSTEVGTENSTSTQQKIPAEVISGSTIKLVEEEYGGKAFLRSLRRTVKSDEPSENMRYKFSAIVDQDEEGNTKSLNKFIIENVPNDQNKKIFLLKHPKNNNYVTWSDVFFNYGLTTDINKARNFGISGHFSAQKILNNDLTLRPNKEAEGYIFCLLPGPTGYGWAAVGQNAQLLPQGTDAEAKFVFEMVNERFFRIRTQDNKYLKVMPKQSLGANLVFDVVFAEKTPLNKAAKNAEDAQEKRSYLWELLPTSQRSSGDNKNYTQIRSVGTGAMLYFSTTESRGGLSLGWQATTGTQGTIFNFSKDKAIPQSLIYR